MSALWPLSRKKDCLRLVTLNMFKPSSEFLLTVPMGVLFLIQIPNRLSGETECCMETISNMSALWPLSRKKRLFEVGNVKHV